VENTIDSDGIDTTALTVANLNRWPVNDGEMIAQEMAKTTVMSAHPQTGPNVDTISYREHLDDTHNATLYFWLGNETTTVQSVFVRFHVDPLRSTIKSVAGASTSAGPSDKVTADAGGSVTSLPISNGSVARTGPPAGIYDHGAGETSDTTATAGVAHHHLAPHDHDITHNHTLTLATHQHGMAHSHSFTPVVNTLYGVFDESSANTYAATDLEWKTEADGSWTAIAAADAISGASGWYGIEIAGRIATNFRPTTAVNDVQFRVKAASKVGKTAQLTVQIERRTSIQSIAVY
jgi:hypothetical protein